MMPKFRSMYVDTPMLPTVSLTDPQSHITPIGNFLRRTSLDEIPQVISVIRGHMSLVGPRPVITSETELLKKRQECGIDTLLPGITGWAQINGRDALKNNEKVRLDQEYLNRRSLFFDMKIIFKTFAYVILKRGIKH